MPSACVSITSASRATAHAGSAVFDIDLHSLPPRDAERHLTPLHARAHAVPYCVLHQRLQRERWNPRRRQGLRQVHAYLQPLAEPRLLDVEIGAYHLQLLLQRDERTILVERLTQHPRQNCMTTSRATAARGW